MVFALIVMDHTASSVSFKQLHFQGSVSQLQSLALTGPKNVCSKALPSACVIKDCKAFQRSMKTDSILDGFAAERSHQFLYLS